LKKIAVSTLLLFSAICFANAKNQNQAEVKADSIEIDNSYIKVLRNSTCCASAHSPGFGTRVIVALDQMNVKSDLRIRALNRGEIAVFPENVSYEAPKAKFFEISIKKNHPPPSFPEEWIEPKKNSVIYNDDEIRIFEERLAPGDTRELHSHAQRIVVKFNYVQLTDPRFKPNGSATGGIQVPNTVKFAEPVVHVVKNLSKEIALFNVVIEFKLPKKGEIQNLKTN